MKKIGLFTLMLLLVSGLVQAEGIQVISPDGKLSVSILVENGAPVYSVMYNGKIFLEKSPLGLKTNVGDFTIGLTMNEQVTRRKIDETYELENIKQSRVHYEASEGVFTFMKDDKPAFDVVFRVSNKDVAFKYRVYQQGERMVCMVDQEYTGFLLPEGTTTFLCPQSKPMVGFARTIPSYETPYKADEPWARTVRGEGYTFPCLFRVSTNGWVLISETGVRSHIVPAA